MRTSVLGLSYLTFATLALLGCGENSAPAPEPTKIGVAGPQTPVTERVNEADKAAVDTLGTDVEKLLAEYNQVTGVRQEYALFRLSEAMVDNPEGIELVEKNTASWSAPWRAAKEARTKSSPQEQSSLR
jgi:hypothetical protein